jgi:hypothetical protein
MTTTDKAKTYTVVSRLPGRILIGSTWIPAGSSEIELTDAEAKAVKSHPALQLLTAAA